MLIVDHQFAAYFLALIKQSVKEICISTFKIEKSDKPRGKIMKEILDALLEKNSQGVKIKMLFNWHDDKKSIARTNEPVGRFLKAKNIEVKHLKNNRCCHAKTIISDGNRAIVGSHNLSCRSLMNNFEISYLISEPVEVETLRTVFMHTWQDAKKF